jgi:hypothetical protein
VQLVIELRNHFVHYKPEWQDVDAEHHFERLLKNANVIENQPIRVPWFPNKALGAGVAERACDISARFAKSWWRRMSLAGNYDASFNQLSTP